MASSYTIWALILASLFSVNTASTLPGDDTGGGNSSSLSAYQVLQQYDFPVGILPKGVTGYKIDRETGKFELYLPATCKFKIDSYELEYGTTVSGVVTTGKISNLEGVKVHILFIWLNIVEVVHSGDQMQFSVGIASAGFPLDGFYESPQCGCGFDCDGLEEEDLLVGSAVSSI
ncbi:unnamed protein product [Linum tenue]|uniref:Uncharacterized protein n=1 Tax=Linum tenue TaxID=586396 RepID=A0AAV0RB38_9ROSI|nr:unnamed protein product [Linum tenue]